MAGELGFSTGPYVSVATFCELVLEGKDDVVSLIRLIDVLNVQAEGPEAPNELPTGVIQPKLVVVLRAGQALGSQTVGIVVEKPDGSRSKPTEVSVNFPGGPGSGARLVVDMQIEIESAGLYWADILVNDRLTTRVPLEVRYGFRR
jgi:hypothetical protein